MTIDRAAVFYNSHTYRMLGRIAPGADTTAVEAELASFAARLPEAFPRAYTPDFFEGTGFRTEATPLAAAVIGDVAGNLWIMFAGVGLVLLIACANVANLFLVRMEARRRELAVRAALGAGRAQVGRYLVTEGLVLSVVGALLALLVSRQAVAALARSSVEGLPRLSSVTLGGSTILFTLALAGIMGAGLALQPLFLHTRVGPAGALAEGGRSGGGGRRAGRFRAALVITQVAMALVLVVSAGLLVESMRKLTAIDPGVDAKGVLTMQLNLTRTRYPDDPSLWRFYRDALERIRRIPGVQAAGMSRDLPLQDAFGCTVQAFEQPLDWERLRAEGSTTTCAGQEPTTPGYFEAMGIPLLRGRLFTEGDNDDPTRAAVIVSQAFAQRFWPGEDALGKRVAASGRNRGYHEVVGVVGDVPASTLDGPRAVAIYYPMVLNPSSGISLWPGTMQLAVKTDGIDADAVLPAIRGAISALDPEVPLANVRPLRNLIGQSMARLSFTALLLAVAAGTALLLAAVGLYGVVSYVVTQRTREIGMRLAIGARPTQLQRTVVGQSLLLAGVGLMVGGAGALAATRVLRGLLYGVEPTEPTAFAGAAALLLGVTLLASWIPARRASRVDPTEALRSG
jgi:predicted permease